MSAGAALELSSNYFDAEPTPVPNYWAPDRRFRIPKLATPFPKGPKRVARVSGA